MTDVHTARIARDWLGKSEGKGQPAIWHMLDVGAVAMRLCALQPLSGAATVDRALCLLVALHDLGKISASFRDMLKDGRGQMWRHWEHSGLLMREHDDLLAAAIGGSEDQRGMLYEAVAGHHGGPRVKEEPHKREQQLQEIGEDARKDAADTIRALAPLFAGASLDPLDEARARTLTWPLNGLTVQADWIGSNIDWFPPHSPDIPIERYWAGTVERAERAVAKACLHLAAPCPDGETRVLDRRYTPHPMQAEVLATPLPDGPMLAIIEDATGAGKTEGALILAARMMAAGKARGLFFALPTMATANAMLHRLERIAPELFDRAPTLGLSHGAAALSDAFRVIRGRDGSNPESGPHCGRWLSDDRRRVLLADVGVGTIDQALLAVLPTRFNGLRLRALAARVMIVDEAHSYDPYMAAQLERLLTFQARLCGSAVLMTATLPAQQKQRFVEAFQKGLRERPPGFTPRRQPAAEPAAPAPYPALTIAGQRQELTPVDAAPATVREVAVTRLPDAQTAVDLIRGASGHGAACLWVRNAVDDAIAAVELFRAEGIEAELLHARFATCDRLSKEDALQNRFGKQGRARAGRVLVATQVAEQSLDLDFDVMVTDLAPIGAMIQRAGRLWRHMDERPAATRPVPGPHLHVLSPDPDDVPDARWLHQVLGRGAYVYPPPVMWRSARALFDAGAIRAPGGLRGPIEAVEGAEPIPLAAALENTEFEYEGQKLVERQMAANSLLDPHEPFAQERMEKVWDDEKFPTRLGVPQVTLALAVEGPGGLRAYAETGPNGWALSEVQLSAVRYALLEGPDQTRQEIAAVKADWSEARAKYTVVAPLGEGGRICEGLRYDPDFGLLILEP